MILLALLATPPAQAESFYDPTNVALLKSTVLQFTATAGEVVSWELDGGPTLFAPDMSSRGTFAEQGGLRLDETGVWTIYLTEDQPDGWDVTVYDSSGAWAETGRVFSTSWNVQTVNYQLDQSFYVPVPINTQEDALESGQGRLMKLDLGGIWGDQIRIRANTTGLPETPLQSSAPTSSAAEPEPALRLYLDRPALSWLLEPDYPDPPAENLAVRFDDDTCDLILLDTLGATLSFETDLVGSSIFVCDIDGDGIFDPSSADGDVVMGVSPIDPDTSLELKTSWQGEASTAGAWVEAGSYSCVAGVMVGDVHALIHGARVADPGVRWFELDKAGALGVDIFWNDALVADGVRLTSGEEALLHSSTDINTETYDTPAVANENAHGWGNLSSSTSRGEAAWIDTWTSAAFYLAGETELILLHPDRDADGDGLPSDDECIDRDTDPLDADTDDGGVDDGAEVAAGTDPLDPVDDTPDENQPDDTGTPDKSPGEDVRGDFAGGAGRCATLPAAPRALLLPALLVAGALLRRRSHLDGCSC